MHEVRAALEMHPDYVTVYSVEAARRVSEAAQAVGRPQDLLLQIYAPDDVYFPGQEGGFRTTEALAAAREIAALPDVTLAGVTSFPVLEYDYSGESEVAFTPNMRTIVPGGGADPGGARPARGDDQRPRQHLDRRRSRCCERAARPTSSPGAA